MNIYLQFYKFLGERIGKMKKRILCILVMTLLIASVVLSTSGVAIKITTEKNKSDVMEYESNSLDTLDFNIDPSDYTISDNIEVSIDSSDFEENTFSEDQYDIYEGLHWKLYVTVYWDPPQPEKSICLWVDESTMPEGATFPECNCGYGEVTSTFEWTPAIGQAGTYEIVFYAGESCYEPAGYFTVTVVVHPMDLEPQETYEIPAGQEWVLELTAYWVPPQPEKPICLWVDESTLPEGATFTPCHCDYGQVTSEIIWTPTENQIGEYIIVPLVGDTCGYYEYPYPIEVIVYEEEEPPTIQELIDELDEVIEKLEEILDELDKILEKLTDSDGDGIPDYKDTDRDGDGIQDYQDEDPDDPNKNRDTDGDGKNDGGPNGVPEDNDIDGDGQNNDADTDDDGDGNSDEFEDRANDLRQKAYQITDPLIDAALKAMEEMNKEGDAIDDGGDLGGDTTGATLVGDADLGEVEIDTDDPGGNAKDGHFWDPKDVDHDGDTDDVDVINTIVHEARHAQQMQLRGPTESEANKDFDGDGNIGNKINGREPRENDKDADLLPENVPPNQDLDDIKDGDPNNADPDAVDTLEDDAYDFQTRTNVLNDPNWTWENHLKEDLIEELNSVIDKLDDVIEELERIIVKLEKLNMPNKKLMIEDDLDAFRDIKTVLESIISGVNDDEDWWDNQRENFKTLVNGCKNYAQSVKEDYEEFIEEIDISDLESEGSLSWNDVKPGGIVTGVFSIKNVGEDDSKLNWEIADYPEWGTWTIEPSSGKGLTTTETQTIQVTVTAPGEEKEDFTGKIKIVNSHKDFDYDTISISLSTPKNKEKTINTPFLKFLENYPILYQLLQLLI